VDPGPDRGRIEGRSRGPSRSAPVDIERENKALRQYAGNAPRTFLVFSIFSELRAAYEIRAARRCRCALDVTPGCYSHSRTFDIGDCSVHRVPRQVLRAVACRYSRHGVFVRAPLASPQPHSARGGAAPAGHGHRWPRVQKANALYRSISLAAAPRSCMRLRLWQFKP
jgi:hypothetical protein